MPTLETNTKKTWYQVRRCPGLPGDGPIAAPRAETKLCTGAGHHQVTSNTRDRLVEEHEVLVQTIAKRALLYARSIGATAELDDLVGLAHEGLLRAAGSFDPTKGVPFAAYAWLRVMGHIKDSLRDDDYLTRRERQVVQSWLRGDELGKDQARRAARLASQRPKPLVGEEAVQVPSDMNVEETALAQLQVREAFTSLNPMEKAVLSYRYLDGMNFSAIKTLLRVTAGRVSQVHRAALSRLRQSLEVEAI